MGIISAWWLMYDWGVIAHQSQIFLSSNLQGIKNTSILVCESGHVSGSHLSLPSANPSERLITGMSKLLFCCYFRRRQATARNTCMSAYTGYGYPEVKSILKARFQAISFFPYVQQNTKCIAKGRMIKQRISERKPTAHSHLNAWFICAYMYVYVKQRILHARAWIGILSSSVQLDISCVSAANEWDIKLNTRR